MNCFKRGWASIGDLASMGAVSGLVVMGALLPAVAQTPPLQQVTSRAEAGSLGAASAASRNVYLAGGQARTAAPVAGDLVAVGGQVVVDHPVTSDATLAGGSVDVHAAVGDDLRAAGGAVTLDSSVGGEFFASAGSISVTRAARVGHTATLFAGSVVIDGVIDGPLKVSAQRILLNGQVNGDARLVGEQIELGPTAKISGALSYASPTELSQVPGAAVRGAITREERTAGRYGERGEADRRMHMEGSTPGWAGWTFGFLAVLAVAAVFLLLFPVFAARASDTTRTSPWQTLAAGLGTVVAVPVLAVLLFITVLGIPLGMVVMALYPALLMMGYVLGVLTIARLAQAVLRKAESDSYAVTIGFFALALLLLMGVANVPFVGALANGALMVMGLGGCSLVLVRRHRASGTTGPVAPADNPKTPLVASLPSTG
jgi:cytoskeletal protein CcmA (bactofilin family)